MELPEVLTLVVAGASIMYLTPNTTTRLWIIGMIGLAIALINVPDCSNRDHAPSIVTARRAALHNSDNQNLAMTRNPRHVEATDASSARNEPVAANSTSDPSPPEKRSEESTLPSTANPNYIGKSVPHDQPEDKEKDPPDNMKHTTPLVDPYAFAYTNEALQTRREEFIFRSVPLKQTTEARKRMLDNMYQELLDTNMKTDPGLRPVGKNGDNCEPMRGLVKPHRF